MEINFELKYDELREDGSRASDGIIRDISHRFPDAIWEKYQQGWKILV